MSPPAPKFTTTHWLIIIIASIGFLFDTYELLMTPLVAAPAIAELLKLPMNNPIVTSWVGNLLWIAALLSPRPPALLVLNEPETSLHPDLLPALARLIARASSHTQVIVVSHAAPLVDALLQQRGCHAIRLDKRLGETIVTNDDEWIRPGWHWMTR